jgi:hypothetical protein
MIAISGQALQVLPIFFNPKALVKIFSIISIGY